MFTPIWVDFIALYLGWGCLEGEHPLPARTDGGGSEGRLRPAPGNLHKISQANKHIMCSMSLSIGSMNIHIGFLCEYLYILLGLAISTGRTSVVPDAYPQSFASPPLSPLHHPDRTSSSERPRPSPTHPPRQPLNRTL